MAMQEKLNPFKRNVVWNLVPKPPQKNIIQTKWVCKNKLNEHGKVVRNKAKFIAQGYNQQEGIDFSKTLAPFARLEVIKILLSYAINHNIILYQMDVTSSFLNGVIFKEVYVKQPIGFEDSVHPYFVFKLRNLFMDSNKLQELGMRD